MSYHDINCENLLIDHLLPPACTSWYCFLYFNDPPKPAKGNALEFKYYKMHFDIKWFTIHSGAVVSIGSDFRNIYLFKLVYIKNSEVA